ncbi:uncharacterized protein C8orf76 homolog [Chanos chanos]|uniref:Uncharacterized protein C8orf76 homolog n=1 Tax=Chanos chanos TaxID=29144 RepID=A0A6J2W121_CHACN|nr:uncharacterized protein C8orf76 homolog [Chanos chanos]
MEILGSTFDDSVFEESRNRVATVLPTYNAKVCEPQWFCEETKSEDVLEKQKTFKFRADLAYRRKQFQTALDDYTACLSLIPDNNLSIKRDVLEGIARCFCYLGKRDEALTTIENLRKEASNTCHLTCVLQLELNVHERFGDMRGRISALQQLCSIHPFNPWHWLKLASSYQMFCQHFPFPSSMGTAPPYLNGTVDQQVDPGGKQQAGEDRDIRFKACMCYIRAKLLIGLLRIQQSSFVLESSERALQEIDEALQRLQPSETTVRIISEVIAEDLNPETMREENQDGESLTGLCIRDFNERWWDKLNAALLKEEGTDLTKEQTAEGR